MKITFILPFAGVNGGNRVVATYARLMEARGHEVRVISQPFRVQAGRMTRLKQRLGLVPTPSEPTLDMLDFLGPRHKVLSKNRPLVASDVPDGDVVIATWWRTAEWVAALPPSKGRKFYLLQGYETFAPHPVERVAATYAAGLKMIAVSGYIRDAIAQNHGIAGIDVIHNAVDIGQFQAPARDRNARLRVGFIYTPQPIKNIGLALEALRLARQTVPDLQAQSFGIPAPGAELPLPDWCDYVQAPAQDAIPGLYAACDLWLFTSHHEGFGLPILEAMACRTPVLATHAGAAPDLITGKNGVLLPSEPEAFAQEIIRFAQMPAADWTAFSDQAHDTATSYTWEDATDKLLALLQTG